MSVRQSFLSVSLATAVLLGPATASAQYVSDQYSQPARVVVGAPRVVYDWDPDVPPPDGYTLEWDTNTGMLAAGIGLFAAGYFTAIIAGAVGTTGTGRGQEWVPLFIPVGGPFAAIGTLDPSPGGLGALIADGVLQAGGVLGIGLAFVDTRYKIIRYAGVDMLLVPAVGSDQRGLVLRGSF